MNHPQEVFNTLLVARLGFWHIDKMRPLLRECGSATALVERRHELRESHPELPPRLVEGFRHPEEAMRKVEEEMLWADRHGVEILTPTDPRYPRRLSECQDAPLALFFRGTADLNAEHVVSVVGTRHCTAYGQDLIQRFMADLQQLCPDTLIISGLAYGVDIQTHRQALLQGMPTVGVVAHGLDTIYPPAHRDTAAQMTHQGGLLSEYFTHTNADKANFVRRNRIVAGMSDATILVESAAHGGGLITTTLARAYDREVLAFPGAVGAPYSEGCNHLIAHDGGRLITSAEDFVDAMTWRNEPLLQRARREGIERQLFPSLTADQQKVVDTLTAANDLTINQLSLATTLPMGQLSAQLFQLEMQGIIRSMPGGVYHLIR